MQHSWLRSCSDASEDTYADRRFADTILGKRSKDGIVDYLRQGSVLNRDNVHFLAEFDAHVASGHLVAAEALLNKRRRAGLNMDVSRWDALLSAWLVAVRAFMSCDSIWGALVLNNRVLDC